MYSDWVEQSVIFSCYKGNDSLVELTAERLSNVMAINSQLEEDKKNTSSTPLLLRDAVTSNKLAQLFV